jgi:ribosomal protein L23
MLYEVAVTQCNIFNIDSEDKDVKDYIKKGHTLKEYVTENCMWEETLGTYYFEIDIEEVK